MKLKLLKSLLILVVATFVFFLIINQNKKNSPTTNNQTSNCLKLLEHVNSSKINENQWEAVEINEVNGKPVSNNIDTKKFQEAVRNQPSTQANLGPFIMEKNYKEGGEYISETDPGLIKCAQDRIIVSIWQPQKDILYEQAVNFISKHDKAFIEDGYDLKLVSKEIIDTTNITMTFFYKMHSYPEGDQFRSDVIINTETQVVRFVDQ